MEHQYPVAITGDEHMLAELMLPDQAHMRNQDWTIFFLHKDTSQEEEDQEKLAREEKRRRQKRRRDRAAGIITEEDEGYDDFDQDDDFDDDDDESIDSDAEDVEGPPLVYVLNLVNTKQDKTVKRGAVVKAMAICTRHPFLHIYKVSRDEVWFISAGRRRQVILAYTDNHIATFAPGSGRILQIAGAGNFSNALRRRQCYGPVTYAKIDLSGKAIIAIERKQGLVCSKI